MDFTFGGIPKNANMKDVHRISDDTLIAREGDGSVKVFLDETLSDTQINKLKAQLALKKLTDYEVHKVLFLDVACGGDEKQVGKLYRKKRVDVQSIVNEGDLVISFGRAIYSLSDADDLNYSHFYDYIFNKTYFYSPFIGSYVFPVDSVSNMYDSKKDVFLDNYRFQFMLLQIERVATAKAKGLLLPPRVTPLGRTVLSAEQFEIEASRFLNDDSKELMAWDLETDSLDRWKANPTMLSFAFDDTHGYGVLWEDVNVDLFIEMLKKAKSIGANLAYDVTILYRLTGYICKIHYDIRQGSHALNETNSDGLKANVFYYTPYGGYDKALEEYKEKHNIASYADIPMDIQMPYGIDDSTLTFKVYLHHMAHIKQIDKQTQREDYPYNLEYYVTQAMMPSHNLFLKGTLKGIGCSKEKLREYREVLLNELGDLKRLLIRKLFTKDFARLESQLEGAKGDGDDKSVADLEAKINAKIDKLSFNVDSTEQMGLAIKRAGYKHHGLAKKGHYKTGDDQIKRWQKDGCEFADVIALYRKRSQMLKTYIGSESDNTGYWKEIHEDGLFHSEMNTMLADSGRNTCKSPNLQQVPSHGFFSKEIRSLFVPEDKDAKMVSLDYSGLQLRISTMYTQDPAMRDVFINLSGDLHSMTAFGVFCEGREFDFITVETVENGVVSLHPSQDVKVIREGTELTVGAGELSEGDEIIKLL